MAEFYNPVNGTHTDYFYSLSVDDTICVHSLLQMSVILRITMSARGRGFRGICLNYLILSFKLCRWVVNDVQVAYSVFLPSSVLASIAW